MSRLFPGRVATATIVGSILANVLLVLGLAFVVGGAKNGRQDLEHNFI